MGIELLTEEQYRELQQLGDFDMKSSSWVQTPSDIRERWCSILRLSLWTCFRIPQWSRLLLSLPEVFVVR